MNLYTNGMGVFGDFGIFDVPIPLTDETGEMPGFTEFAVPQVDETNYLQKGEKILSLLREKKPRSVFAKDNVMELVKPRWEKTKEAVTRNIGTILEEEFLETLKQDPESYEVLLEACDNLMKKLPAMVRIEPEERTRELRLMDALCRNSQNAVLRVTYADEDMVIPVGASFKKRYEGGSRLREDRGNYIHTYNFKNTISGLYLRQYILDKIRKLKNDSDDEETYKQNRIIGKLQERYLAEGRASEYEDLKANMSRYWARYGMVLFYPQMPEAETAVLKLDVCYVQRILSALQNDYVMAKEEARMEKVLSGDYAKSFQTKKNIPQKCIRAMSRSGFNDYFGYVEFDEECDLNLMEELCREYQAFAKALGIDRYPEVSLRFRKLGNHKASGLYYYLLKCLCVDVRSPQSMVHEVGHMVDYHLDHISAKYAFQKIYDRYEELLRNYCRTSNAAEVKVLRGNTKYNLKYYLMPTEVFARCFEMYVVRIRGIDNSLCKPEGGFAYPEDEEMMKVIREFYDGLFERADVKEDVE